MFAHDKNWVLRMREAISTGLTAEAAVERVQNDIRARMDRQPDPFVRERLHDLDDLANRLQRILTNAQNSVMDELPEKAILFARSMGAAELLDYDRKKLCGIVLEEAGIASHIAIVAKALDIAAVGNVDNAVKLAKSGDDAVVDAKTGDVYIRPSMEVIDTYTDKLQMLHQKVEAYAKLRDLPATSLDNKNIGLLMNSGLAVDLPHLEETGADGIGLFRTELQFMVAKRFPRLDAQLATYKAALDAAGDKSVIFRTLDVGGDKILPYMRSEHREDNPELGWRAIRMGLDRPGLFRTQIRALLRAAEGRRISVMLPMVAEIAEIAEARRLIDTELKHLAKHGYITPGKIRMGVMLEVPSLLWQLDHLLPMVDFISVGSNDLAQFLFAADRVNSLVNSRFDPLLPAMLKVLRHIVDKTSEHNVPLTICGALAGKPLEAMVLLGLGFRSLSMAPSSIAPIKLMIRSLNITNLEDILLPLLAKSHRSLRDDMLKFARTQQVILE
jgi:phosphotransferase system enzyme I (PtsP)